MRDYSKGGWITTRFGHKVMLTNPDPDSLDIRDIAWALARIRRWGAQQASTWTVGQHSIVVARLCPDELKLSGLMHDAAEAYIGDIVQPLKRLIPEASRIEDLLQVALSEKFGFIYPDPPEVKELDYAVCQAEADLWMNHPEAGWCVHPKQRRLTEDEKILLRNIEPDHVVERVFLGLFTGLGGKV